MSTFEVKVGDATYEVDAPDEKTAWKMANEAHTAPPAAQPGTFSLLGLQPPLLGHHCGGHCVGLVGNILALYGRKGFWPVSRFCLGKHPRQRLPGEVVQ